MTHVFNHRPNLPDDRDLVTTPPNQVAVDALPLEFDLWEHFPEIARWDQGQQGSCGGHARERAVMKLAMDLGVEFKDTTQDDEADGEADRAAPAYAYYTTRQLQGDVGQDSGVDNRTLFKALGQYGYVHEASMPYSDSDFTTAPSEDAYKAGEKLEGSKYRLLTPGHGAMRIQLASGIPIVGGFNVPDYFEDQSVWDPATEVLLPPRLVPQFSKYVGGHDACFTGYDYSLKRFNQPVFYVDNSWGQDDWGMAINAPSGKKGRFVIAATFVPVFFDLTIITKEA
jgi:hypothetical protein